MSVSRGKITEPTKEERRIGTAADCDDDHSSQPMPSCALLQKDCIVELSAAYETISVDDFVEYILKDEIFFSTLIIDCRYPVDFWNKHIKYSINAPVIAPPNASGGPISKSDAIRHLLERFPHTIEYLNKPGFYTDIVVLEQSCSNKCVSEYIKSLLDTLMLWQAGVTPKPSTCLLQGGFEAFSSKFPQWLTYELEIERPLAITTAGGVTKLLKCQNTSFDSIHVGKDKGFISNFCRYLEHLKSVKELTITLRDLQIKKQSLDAIYSIVNEEGKNETSNKLDAMTPTEVRCPVCLEVFIGQIFQCRNGHCICFSCSNRLGRCPECRLPYYSRYGRLFKYRVRGLEKVLDTLVKFPCPNAANGCPVNLKYSELSEHIQNCADGEYADVERKLQHEINLKSEEINRLQPQLDKLNEQLLQHEQKWNLMDSSVRALVPNELLKKVFKCARKLKKIQTAVAQELDEIELPLAN